MKTFKKIIKIILVAPLVILLLFVIGLSIKFSPTYVYRLAKMNVPDAYDYKNFHNRTIAPSNDTFEFHRAIDSQYVERLFEDKVEHLQLKNLREWADTSQTTALIVIRKDTILYEEYFNGFTKESYFHSQSMAKSFISFLIGAAIDDGLIKGVNDPMTDYIPELIDRDPRFGKITIENLLEMRSGLKYVKEYIPGTYIHAPWHDEAVGYYHEDVRSLLLNKMEIARDPGDQFEYNNYNTSFLGLIIERATGMTVSKYLEEKLWSKIMKNDALFSVDSEENGFEYMPSRLIARAMDYAHFGRLFLHNGNWNGEEILSSNFAKESITEDTTISKEIYPDWFGKDCRHVYYKYQWWGHANCDGTYQFAASGNLGQNIYIIPDEEIIIVHCGNSLEYYSDFDLWNVADKIRSKE